MNKTQLTLTFISLAALTLLSAYMLFMTGHYANRTPRERAGLIVLFILSAGYLVYNSVTVNYGS